MNQKLRTEVLAHGTEVFCSAEHSFGEDALLLADFCGVKPREAVCELGTGCGIIPLAWHDAGHIGPCTALEQSAAALAQLAHALQSQKISHIQPVQANLRTWQNEKPFDLVCCNPPYFAVGAGCLGESPARRQARQEVLCTLEDVCAAARRLLKDGGRLCLCQRPQRLAEVFCAMHATGLAPRRLQLVAKHGKAPWLCLVEARKNRGEGLTVLPLLER